MDQGLVEVNQKKWIVTENSASIRLVTTYGRSDIMIAMAKGKAGLTNLGIPTELHEEFTKFCDQRGRKYAPTAARILQWLLQQDDYIQRIVLGEIPPAPNLLRYLADEAGKDLPRAENITITPPPAKRGSTPPSSRERSQRQRHAPAA
jgi:hypothetical protein